MECLKPNKGWYDKNGQHKFGNPPFSGQANTHDIPCGYCDICRKNKAKLRGFKSFTNSFYVKSSMFITLTYGKYHPVTSNGLPTLDKTAVPLFVKRLRKFLETEHIKQAGDGDYKKGIQMVRSLSKEQRKEFFNPIKIGVIYCGEYGDEDARPHYHLIVFNYAFTDQYYWRRSKKGHSLYRSPQLETLWRYGFAEIGEVTPATCTYVATYIYKKQYGMNKADYYKGRVEEFVQTPKRNYVTGREYIKNNIDSIADHGCFKTIEGYAIGIDTHTMNWIEQTYPEHALKIRLQKESYEISKLSKQEKEAIELTMTRKKELMKARR